MIAQNIAFKYQYSSGRYDVAEGVRQALNTYPALRGISEGEIIREVFNPGSFGGDV